MVRLQRQLSVSVASLMTPFRCDRGGQPVLPYGLKRVLFQGCAARVASPAVVRDIEFQKYRTGDRYVCSTSLEDVYAGRRRNDCGSWRPGRAAESSRRSWPYRPWYQRRRSGFRPERRDAIRAAQDSCSAFGLPGPHRGSRVLLPGANERLNDPNGGVP